MTDGQSVKVKEKWRWSMFWQRLKKRELLTEDYDALLLRVFIPLLSPAILYPMLFNSENAVGVWAVKMAFVWVAPPAVAVFGFLSYCTKPESNSIYRKIWGVVAPVIVGFVFTYGAASYFYFANALTGSKELVAVHGPVIKKVHATSRFTGFNAYLIFLYEGREIKWLVTTKEYDSHNIGDDYGQMMHRGGAGYFYRWEKLSSWK